MPNVNNGPSRMPKGSNECGNIRRSTGIDVLTPGVDPLLHDHLHIDYNQRGIHFRLIHRIAVRERSSLDDQPISADSSATPAHQSEVVIA